MCTADGMGLLSFLPVLPAPTCVVCGRAVTGRYFRNAWGEAWCTSHDGVRGCMWCGRHADVRLDDGRRRCGVCRATGIDGPEQLQPLRREVLEALGHWFGPNRLDQVPVSAQGGALSVHGARRTGRTQTWSGRDGRAAEITMSPGMPRLMAGAVLAHEYGHVLLAFDQSTLVRRSDLRLEPPVEEGFCEVLAAEWLGLHPGQESEYLRSSMDDNPDPVYGEGFRTMWRRRGRAGSPAALLRELRPGPAPAPAPAPPPGRGSGPAGPDPAGRGTTPPRSRVRWSGRPADAPRPSSGRPPSGSRVRTRRPPPP